MIQALTIEWLDRTGSPASTPHSSRGTVGSCTWMDWVTTLVLTVLSLVLGVILGLVVAVIRTAHDQQRPGRRNPVLGLSERHREGVCHRHSGVPP